MTHDEDRQARIVQRAFQFADSGAFENITVLQRQLAFEGFGEDIHWIERAGVRDALREVVDSSRRLQALAERPSF